MSKKEKAPIGAATPMEATKKFPVKDFSQDYFTADGKRLQAVIAPLLLPGEENAQSAKELTLSLGLSDLRCVSKQVQSERRRGIPICATCNGNDKTGGGYYLPKDSGELERYIKRLERRNRNVGETTDALKYALAIMQGQEVINGQTEKETTATVVERTD